jgi:hypothetical protein
MLRFIIRSACLIVIASSVVIWWARAGLEFLYGPQASSLIFIGTIVAAADALLVLLFMPRRTP